MKRLKTILSKNSGRSRGTITVRRRGGRQKRYLRHVDFKRDKRDIWGAVEKIEYAPNRGADVALVRYEDGERRYILAAAGLEEGAKVVASEMAPIETGNALPLVKIPAGTQVHNVEITPGKGGQMVKGAGSFATVQGREEDYVLVRLPSAEIRRFLPGAWATIGQVGNVGKRSIRIGKAGRSRLLGRRPKVRGVAMYPAAHPHGGGEGRTGVGLKYPKTYTGKRAVGRTRKKRKFSDKLIVSRRKPGKHQGSFKALSK